VYGDKDDDDVHLMAAGSLSTEVTLPPASLFCTFPVVVPLLLPLRPFAFPAAAEGAWETIFLLL
jgi:hypothetical protein